MIESDLLTECKEYETYFSSASVVYDPELKLQVLVIETKDNKNIRVGVCTAGWFVFEEANPVYYETFEGLMNDAYPDFQNTYANDLFDRLDALVKNK